MHMIPARRLSDEVAFQREHVSSDYDRRPPWYGPRQRCCCPHETCTCANDCGCGAARPRARRPPSRPPHEYEPTPRRPSPEPPHRHRPPPRPPEPLPHRHRPPPRPPEPLPHRPPPSPALRAPPRAHRPPPKPTYEYEEPDVDDETLDSDDETDDEQPSSAWTVGHRTGSRRRAWTVGYVVPPQAAATPPARSAPMYRPRCAPCCCCCDCAGGSPRAEQRAWWHRDRREAEHVLQRGRRYDEWYAQPQWQGEDAFTAWCRQNLHYAR